MNKTAVVFIKVILAVLLAVVGYSFFLHVTEQPPVQEIDKAREAIASARINMAERYATEKLKEAETYFEQALIEWQKQNSSFVIFRDYTLVSELAEKSYGSSLTAREQAMKSMNNFKYSSEARFNKLNQKEENFAKYYRNLELSTYTLKLYNKATTNIHEAKLEFKNGNYFNSLKLLIKAEENLSQAEKQAHLKLAGYYRNYPVWEKNVQTAYNLSKKGQTVILIDKLEASLLIIKSGKEYLKIPVELGKNWMTDKTKSGDKATPEGIYKIKQKKGRNKTQYYKALLLDYPNLEDQQKYRQMVNSGKISGDSGIGGLIEIHGEGGKGIHWTDGCIALENSDMDIIFNYGSINTPVIIVGARQTLDEYLN